MSTSITSPQTELLRLLCMSDEELVELFQTKLPVNGLPSEMEYRWKKRLSIYAKSNSVSHEYRWLADALKSHFHDEIVLLRKEIESLYSAISSVSDVSEGDQKNDEKKEKKDEYNINIKNIKKVQSCPTFSSRSFYHFHEVHEILEKTVNGC